MTVAAWAFQVLAWERRADAVAGVPSSSRGWLSTEELARRVCMLRDFEFSTRQLYQVTRELDRLADLGTVEFDDDKVQLGERGLERLVLWRLPSSILESELAARYRKIRAECWRWGPGGHRTRRQLCPWSVQQKRGVGNG